MGKAQKIGAENIGKKFSKTDLTGSLIARTNLSGADFTDAIGYDIDIPIGYLNLHRYHEVEGSDAHEKALGKSVDYPRWCL